MQFASEKKENEEKERNDDDLNEIETQIANESELCFAIILLLIYTCVFAPFHASLPPDIFNVYRKKVALSLFSSCFRFYYPIGPPPSSLLITPIFFFFTLTFVQFQNKFNS